MPRIVWECRVLCTNAALPGMRPRPPAAGVPTRPDPGVRSAHCRFLHPEQCTIRHCTVYMFYPPCTVYYPSCTSNP